MFQKITKYAIYGLVFLLPLFWLPFTVEPFEFNKGYLLLALTAIGIFSWLAQMIFKEKSIKLRTSKLDLFVLGFLLLMVVSVVFSSDRAVSLFGDYGKFWPSLISMFCLAGFYFLLKNNIVSSKDIVKKGRKKAPAAGVKGNTVLKLFLLSTAVATLTAYLSVFGVFAKLSGLTARFNLPSLMLNKGFNMTSGSLDGFAIIGVFAVTILISFLAMGMVLKSKVEKAFGYVMLAAILGILAIVDFWPAWLVVALSLLGFLGFAFWKRVFKQDVNKLALGILFLMISLTFLFADPIQSFLPENNLLSGLPREVLLTQKASWQLGLEAVKSQPVLGSGLASFGYAYSKFKPASFLTGGFWQVRLDRSGSYMAEVLTSMGILGVLANLALIGFVLFLAYKALKEKNRGLVLPLSIGFLALAIGQFVYYQNIVLAFSFWLMLTLLAVLLQKPEKIKEFNFKDFPEIGLVFSVVFWVAIVAFAFLSFTLTKNYLADINYRNYLLKEDITFLEKAVRLNNSSPIYRIVLARAYLDEFIKEASKTDGDISLISNWAALAVDAGRKAEEAGENNTAVHEILAVVYREINPIAEGSLEWSIKSFERAIELEPKNPAFLTGLAGVHLMKGDQEEARKLFDRALSLKPDYLEAQLQLAFLDEADGDLEAAGSRLEQAVESNPFSVEGHFQLGKYYYNRQNYNGAGSQFLAALSLFPNHSNSLFSLALIYEKQGQKDDALLLLEKVLELNPGNDVVKEKIAALNKKESAPELEIETEE